MISALSLGFLASILAWSVIASCQPEASSYAPCLVQCPTEQKWVRSSGKLSAEEEQWVGHRKRVVYDEFAAYLKRLRLHDFDVDEYLCRIRREDYANVPVMAFATSGGGTASAFTGSGGYGALDARNAGAVAARTGGLLQSMTYLTGQSGGSWPTIGSTAYDFPTTAELLQYWQPWVSKIDNATITNIFKSVAEKHKAGFNVTLSDFYGQVFGIEYMPDNGTGTFASIARVEKFKNHSMPMPLLQITDIDDASSTEYGFRLPDSNGSAAFYEISPFEFGSWGGKDNPTGFLPTEYLGTTLRNGLPINNQCVVGFDRISTVLGISANAINFWEIEGLSNYTLAPFPKRSEMVPAVSSRTDKPHNTVRREEPISSLLAEDEFLYEEFSKLFGLDQNSTTYGLVANPYLGLSDQPPYYQSSKYLALVDATENGQAIPLWGLIQPQRKTNFIIAWDNDGDAMYAWNNGTNIHNAYLQATSHGLPFPKVPTVNTILSRGYHLKPVLLGCNASLTNTGKSDSPVIAYMANAPYSAYTNFTFSQMLFSEKFMNEIFENSFNLVTQGNGTLARDWVTCLGCAAIERSRENVGMARSQQCNKCFQEYCWDGTEDKHTFSGIVDPVLALAPNVSFAQWNRTSGQ